MIFPYCFCKRFSEASTSTKTSVKTTSENIAPFIDFVVCPSYQMAYKTDIMEYYGLIREEYVKGSSFYPKQHSSGTDPRQLFDSITYKASEIFSKIVVHTLDINEPKITIDLSEGNTSERLTMKTKYTATFGRCYSVELSEKIIHYGIIDIAFETKIDIYVYFGYPGQFMHVDTKAKVKVRVYQGRNRNSIMFSRSIIKFVSL